MNTNFREMAIAFADKQAALRTMTPVEYMALIEETEAQFRAAAAQRVGEPETSGVPLVADPKTAVRKNGVTCCVCGKNFRILSARHLKTHDLTPDQYRALCGYPKDMPLACGILRKQREEKMRSMQLWTRRSKGGQAADQTDGAA